MLTTETEKKEKTNESRAAVCRKDAAASNARSVGRAGRRPRNESNVKSAALEALCRAQTIARAFRDIVSWRIPAEERQWQSQTAMLPICHCTRAAPGKSKIILKE